MEDHYTNINTSNWTPGTRYFTQITDTNHAGWMYIVTLISFVFVIVTFVIRFIVKYGMYGLDDLALLVSTALALCQYISILAGVAKGVGKSTWVLGHDRVLMLQKYAAVHAYLFIFAHCCSKVSTAILTPRLFENGRNRNTYLCWFLIGSSVAYGVGAVMALSIGCNNPYNTFVDSECPHIYPRWQVAMALDMATEALLVLIPFILLYNVKIKKADKIIVIGVFGVRVVDIVFAAFNLHLVHDVRDSNDPALDVVRNLVWTQAELLWSIVAASLPCVRTFLRPFDKIDDEIWRSNDHVYSSSRSGRNWGARRSAGLENLKAQWDGVALRASVTDQSLELRPEAVSHNVVISGPDNASEDRRSWGSQEHIIRMQKEVDVTTSQGRRDAYEIP